MRLEKLSQFSSFLLFFYINNTEERLRVKAMVPKKKKLRDRCSKTMNLEIHKVWALRDRCSKTMNLEIHKVWALNLPEFGL